LASFFQTQISFQDAIHEGAKLRSLEAFFNEEKNINYEQATFIYRKK
jgi:hypothetical protein